MLSDDQIERYARHILLREVGGTGQKRLLASRVALEGLEHGGWLVAWLALAGVGTLRLADPGTVGPDEVEPLLEAADRGRPRDQALAAALPARNPDVSVEVGPSRPGDLQLVRGLPPEGKAGDSLWWGAAGDVAWVLPPGAVACAGCLRSIPDAPPSPATRALAGSLAGGEALLALLGGVPQPRRMILHLAGEPVSCGHGPLGDGA